MEARRSPNFFYIKPEKARARSLKPEPDPSPKIVGPTQPYGESLHVCVLICSISIHFIPFRSVPFVHTMIFKNFPSVPPSLPPSRSVPFRGESLRVCVLICSILFQFHSMSSFPFRSAPCRLCIDWVKLFHFISFSISPSLSLHSVLFWLSITIHSVPLVHVMIEKNFPSLPPSLAFCSVQRWISPCVCSDLFHSVPISFHFLLPVPLRVVCAYIE